MRKHIGILLLLSIFFLTIYATPRKKIAVVLSGGGAKGVAHIGALKVIEEIGMPIDYVVGTSIGAIIGGLYAVGYSPRQLDSIVKNTNWIELLSDKTPRKAVPFPFKEDDGKYLISLSAGKSKGSGGIIKGENILQLLHNLTADCPKTTNFDSLPIPFAAIATDMVTNRRKVIRSGNLAMAMRASMAIPIAFTPIYSGNEVLIDGGFKDNLPIDVAKEMGADIIIAVDAQSELASAEKLQSVAGVANQLMLMICQSEKNDNKAIMADAYIKVNTDGYNAASFSETALDTLIVRGENAARINYLSLLSIKESVGSLANTKRTPFRTIPPTSFLRTYIPDRNNMLKIGLRFDSEDIAALLFSINLQKLGIGEANISLRAGKQSFLDARYCIPLSKSQRISVSNKLGYNDIFIYNCGKKVLNPTYIQNISKFNYIINPSKNLQLETSIHLDYYHYFETTKDESPLFNNKGLFLNYQIGLRYENLNKRYFPTTGTNTHITYTMYTDCHSPAVYSALNAFIKRVMPITSNTTIIPSIYGRFVFNVHTPLIYSNMIGGEGYNCHYEQQIPFSGFTHTEKVEGMLGSVQLKIQQKVCEKQYLTLSGNYAISKNRLLRFLHGEKLYGLSVEYGYESPIGPIDVFFGYSNRTHSLGFYLNMGFGF